MKEKNKIIIADDEMLICALIQKIILWQELNLELVGVANSGTDLFELIKEKHPDIVITDICMPEMDGIEVIKQAKYANIDCKFIIVSGYRQFEYAHNALKYNVNDYILKPIDGKELNDALHKLVNDLNSIKNQQSLDQLTKHGQQQSSHIMKRFFINRVIWELQTTEMSLEEIKQKYGINFKEGLFQALYIKLDVTEKTEDFGDNFMSIQQKIEEIFQRQFEKICDEILIDIDSSKITIGLNYNEEHSESVLNQFKTFFDYVKNIADLFVGLNITIGVGRNYSNVNGLSKSVIEAKEAVACRMVEGIDRIIYWDRIQFPSGTFAQVLYKQKEPCIRKDFEILDIEDFKLSMKELFHIPKSKFHSIEMLKICIRIQDIFFEANTMFSQTLGDDHFNEDFVRKQIEFNIDNAVSVAELEQGIVEPLADAIEALAAAAEKQNIKPIRIAIQYIEQHYAKQISLEEVANEVGLNPVYFSNVFKKKTGENFIDYLTKYRMDAAKELLRASSQNINEIAESIGYSDARYFSKVFRKVVGIKPTEYRKIYG